MRTQPGCILYTAVSFTACFRRTPRRRHGYRAQARRPQARYTAESIYVRIDEVHDGTKYDPIPYGGNTALEDGRYYAQDGVIYRCTRGTGNAVFQPLAELAGIYVEVVGT